MPAVNISKEIRVRDGDIFRARVTLRKSNNVARVSVWSTVGGYPYSPHTPSAYNDFDDKPIMVKPLYVRLCSQRQSYIFEFRADEDMQVVLKQEKGENFIPAKTKVKRYGKTYQKIQRWIVEVGERFGWHPPASHLWRE